MSSNGLLSLLIRRNFKPDILQSNGKTLGGLAWKSLFFVNSAFFWSNVALGLVMSLWD
jgi:hypothetical protein